GSKCEGRGAAFEIRERGLQRIACRVARARIVEPLMHTWARLYVGGGRVDRRHDRAGLRIGPLPAVNHPCGESLRGLLFAHGRQTPWNADSSANETSRERLRVCLTASAAAS